jgi:hypothetical protein
LWRAWLTAALTSWALVFGFAAPAAAQLFARPWLQWRTLHAGRFDVHYPAELGSWAQFVAERLPAVDSAVTTLVGYAPPMRVQIVIEDPFDISNGFAFTLLDHPAIVFWASPPDPRESIGQFRTWGEMLAVHEFGHVAHLTRPSRNPLLRGFWRLAPVNLGPLALRSPRWVIEGYATYIEGVVTGSGRPHGVWRPAILRQWAIEGRLPNYAQLSSWSDFEGPDFAYLAGSAFLEWLARRHGDSSLVDVWRRLSARVNRSFDEAFAGVYGDAPAVLYDRFRAEVTADAVAIDSALARAGPAEGELLQHLARGTGDPAISGNGQRVAVVLRPAGRPSRVVVWSTAPEPDTLERKQRERLLQRDPEDVPARRVYPTSKRAIATLISRDGRPFEDPRWLLGGKQLLLWRATRRPDGALRPELYLWDVASRDVRRITTNAGVRNADPSPDGRHAVGLRCPSGHCDVVTVDLTTGAVRLVAAGDVLTSFARPRWSPDGHTIAVALQRDNRWRIALLDSAGGAARFVDPDDGANRFDPSWIGATSLVVVSDRGGTPNLERVDFDASIGSPVAKMLTRVTGAAIAPEPNPADGSIWFLSLHSRGYDVRRVPRGAPLADLAPSPLLDSRLIPVVIARTPGARVFAPSAISPPRRYALGPRTTRWIPAAGITSEGREATFALVNSDVVGRLTMLGQLAIGSGDAWRGGALDVAWRGWRPAARVAAYDAITSAPAVVASPANVVLDRTDRLTGSRARLDHSRSFDRADMRVGAGGTASWLDATDDAGKSGVSRNLAFGEIAGSARQTGDGSAATEGVLAHVTAGETGGATYWRILTSLSFHAASNGALPIDGSATYAAVSTNAPSFEQLVVGGPPSNLVDGSLLTQRISMAALPTGTATGDRALTYRIATSLWGLNPYYWGVRTRFPGQAVPTRQRVAGVELSIDQTALPVLGLPGARLLAGLAYSLHEPWAHRTWGYLSVTLRP